MAAGDWYYQVWEHRGMEQRVRVVATHKVEADALEEAFNLNYEAIKACSEGYAPLSHWFVQPVEEKHLPKSTLRYFQERLRQCRNLVSEDNRSKLQQFAGNLATAMLLAIKNCESSTHFRLDDRGGRLDGISIDKKESIFALYSGRDRVSIAVCIEEDGRRYECAVREFESETEMIAWLQNESEASATIEDKLIDIHCIYALSKDHYRYEH